MQWSMDSSNLLGNFFYVGGCRVQTILILDSGPGCAFGTVFVSILKCVITVNNVE